MDIKALTLIVGSLGVIAACVFALFAANNSCIRVLAGSILMLSTVYMVVAVSWEALQLYGLGYEFIFHALFGAVSIMAALIFVLASSDLI